MAFAVGGGNGKVRPTMNVTPLVDVVLVLLIIFMVVTPMLTSQFRVNVPEKEKADVPPPPPDPNAPPPIVLRVAADGKLFLNKDEIGEAELPDRLQRVLAARNDRVIFFAAHDEVPYATAMAAMDRARGGGAATIAVLTEALSE